MFLVLLVIPKFCVTMPLYWNAESGQYHTPIDPVPAYRFVPLTESEKTPAVCNRGVSQLVQLSPLSFESKRWPGVAANRFVLDTAKA